jgi:hypothetical protein
MHAQSTTLTTSPTVAELARDLRDELLRHRDAATQPMGEGVGALTVILTLWATWHSGAAHRKAFARRDVRSPRMRAADRARVNLAAGARMVRDGTAVLVSSATHPGEVHRVEGGRCSCPATGACWHLEAARQAPPARAVRVGLILQSLKARRLAAA